MKTIDWIVVTKINVDQIKEALVQNLDLSLSKSFLSDSQISNQRAEVEVFT